MTATVSGSDQNYRPELIKVPPLYVWPPRPLKALRYLLFDLLYPWGFIYLVLAFPTWWYLTPALETMTSFDPGWIGLLWLRNCAFLFLFAGGLHWYLHRRRAQGVACRLNRKDLSGDSKLFLWHDQVKDNMFWSIASGVTIWTGFEAISYWIYASGRLPIIDNPWYFVACIYLLFLWSTTNFTRYIEYFISSRSTGRYTKCIIVTSTSGRGAVFRCIRSNTCFTFRRSCSGGSCRFTRLSLF